MPSAPTIEHHPLQPFLPPNARLLMLGSFPPPQERWCMPSSSRAYPLSLAKKASAYQHMFATIGML